MHRPGTRTRERHLHPHARTAPDRHCWEWQSKDGGVQRRGRGKQHPTCALCRCRCAGSPRATAKRSLLKPLPLLAACLLLQAPLQVGWPQAARA